MSHCESFTLIIVDMQWVKNMIYNNIKAGIFKARPNRFVAHIEIDGHIEICHVKNTGRCKELLLPDCIVYVEEASNTARKTKYSLIAVLKGEKIINMDSQIPNKAVHEWLLEGNLFQDITLIKPEKVYGNSRFDFYIETSKQKIFMEVKGVTLEEDGVVRFPDAPTERGVKHMNELISCTKQGYEAYILFVIQMEDVIK
ncbi:MAG: sfsA, partial [Anaerocolumna sp.]|nr:sfsA [Anaerocolumna sp.]